MTTVVIADDHPLILDGLAGLLEADGFDIRARCANGDDALTAIRSHRPDLAMIDIGMPGQLGLDILARVRTEQIGTRMILLTATFDPDQLMRAVELQVDGLIMKDSGTEAIRLCVGRVLAGEQWLDRTAMRQVIGHVAVRADPLPALTPRETDVAAMVGRGARNKEIAFALGISEGTVKMYLHNLFRKLDIGSRTELALLARERGLEGSGAPS